MARLLNLFMENEKQNRITERKRVRRNGSYIVVMQTGKK